MMTGPCRDMASHLKGSELAFLAVVIIIPILIMQSYRQVTVYSPINSLIMITISLIIYMFIGAVTVTLPLGLLTWLASAWAVKSVRV